MALKKSEKRLLLILSAVVLVFLINQLISNGKKKNGAQKSGITAKVEKIIPSLKSETVRAEKKEVAKKNVEYDSWGKDPFMIQRVSIQQAAEAASIDSSLQLKGIIRKGQNVYALINDQIISVGEEKDGIRVESIEGKEVVCVKNGVRITLQWKG